MHTIHKNYVKCKVRNRLEDQYIQKYDAYISCDNTDNYDKQLEIYLLD